MSFLESFPLPNVNSFESRWVRRTLIVLYFPLELLRVFCLVTRDAARAWKQP